MDTLEKRLSRLESHLLDSLKHSGNIPRNDTVARTISADRELPPPIVQQNVIRSLPPIQEVVPIIEDYFSNFNVLVPLFHEGKFTRMLHQWYANPLGRDEAWAAINVVLALSLQQRAYTGRVGDHRIDEYIGNAQSVLSELTTRETDLKGIQVILGLVNSLSGGCLRPASCGLSSQLR